jgi:XapX domain-containing protein
MKPYLLLLSAGLLVGALYVLLNVRSPTPPVFALLGLLGIRRLGRLGAKD